jgi:small nuclear ribonucleoprotein (snRNP)-like protein
MMEASGVSDHDDSSSDKDLNSPVKRQRLESEAETEAEKTKKSAPGQGQWAQRELRKAQIAMKDAQIEDEGADNWKRKKKKLFKDPMDMSLAMILESLTGYEVTIDLKNDSTVRGKLNSVDKNMNLVLENAVESKNNTNSTRTTTSTPEAPLEMVEIKGNNIYLVHMPAGLDVSSHVERYRKQKEAARKARASKTKTLTAQA